MRRFDGPMNTDTRLYLKGQLITWFKGDTIRTAAHKLYEWVFYMGQRGYSITTISLSWTEGKEFEDGSLLLTYTLIDTVKTGEINFGGK